MAINEERERASIKRRHNGMSGLSKQSFQFVYTTIHLFNSILHPFTKWRERERDGGFQ